MSTEQLGRFAAAATVLCGLSALLLSSLWLDPAARFLLSAGILGVKSEFVWTMSGLLAALLVVLSGSDWYRYYDSRGLIYTWQCRKDVRFRYAVTALCMTATIATALHYLDAAALSSHLERSTTASKREVLNQLVARIEQQTQLCQIGRVAPVASFRAKLFVPFFPGAIHPEDSTFSTDISQVSTIVLRFTKNVNVGQYTNGGIALRTVIFACLVDVHTLDLSRFKLVLDPPNTIRVPVGSTSGADGEMFAREQFKLALQQQFGDGKPGGAKVDIQPWDPDQR